MRAAVGDRIVVQGHVVGDRPRGGIILAVEGQDGGPPYLVRWEDNDHESLFFPGSDSVVEHFPMRIES